MAFSRRTLRTLLAGSLLAIGSGMASAQSCSFHQRLNFADGSKACIGEFPVLASSRISGRGELGSLLPANGIFAIAVPKGDRCPAAVGMAWGSGSLPPIGQLAEPYITERAQAAVRACQETAGETRGCECEVVVQDGNARITRADMQARFGAAKLGGTSTAVAPAPSTAPRAQDPEIARLREELEALRRQSSLQAAPATAASPAPASPPTASARAPSRARALVIGNSRYTSFGRLPNPAQDARAIADKLQSFGIAVDLVLDATRADMIKALNEHSRRSVGTDVNLLFYAGHGMQVEGVNYLIPVDMSADGITAGYVKLAGIALNATLDYLPARTRLIFLDACRDSAASRSLLATRSSVAPGLAPVSVASGTLISYATRDGAVAEDGEGSHSPYTTALLQHIDRPVDISLVLRSVRETVVRLTGGRQEPWEYGSLTGGELVLPTLAR